MSRADSLRLMVLGPRNVGKSALVVKYLTGRFIWEYQSDEETKYDYKISIDGEDVSVEILDAVSVEDHLIKWAEGFMIVYDVTDEESFECVTKIKDEVENIKSARNMSFVVVGNKTDLNHCRKVSQERGADLSLQLAAAHFECCACGQYNDEHTINIGEAFEELCREIQQRRRLNAQTRRRRRSSLSQVKQGLKMLVTSNKNKGALSPSRGSSSSLPTYSRRGSTASTGRRDSGGRSNEQNHKLSLPPVHDISPLPSEKSQKFGVQRSMNGIRTLS